MESIAEALAIAVEHHQAGRLELAELVYRQILAVEPNHADALHLLGVIAQQSGKPQVALDLIVRAIELNGTDCNYHCNLGAVLKALGRLDDAIACYRRALELQPDFARVHYNLGIAFYEQQRLPEAVASYRQAIAIQPDYAKAYYNLGIVLQLQQQFAEAETCYGRAIELAPNYAEAHNNLGNVLKDQARSSEALACYRRALEINPAHAGVYNNLGSALNDQGQPEEALACFRRAVEIKPDFAAAHSSLLLTLHYCPDISPADLAAAHAEYDARHAAPLRTVTDQLASPRDPSRRLRLGFVSPDFCQHPVGVFLVRAVECLPGAECETICYSDCALSDAVTQRFQAAATCWRDVRRLSDEQLAAQIRADRVDILFDLAGHTAQNRLLMFARNPAPVQITWIGYEGTTGLTAMDGLLADRWVLPAESRQHHREQVLSMPDGYVCYAPPAEAPEVGPLPALRTGYPTFASFNNLAKISPRVVAVWAELLRRLPSARLMLKYRGLGDAAVRRRYLDLFSAQGIASQRLDLLPWTSYADYLATYHQADIALDPFPFSGSVTTCEALWMGVPVVTCPGATFASRHGLSHLSNIGLTETIARDLDDYVELAIRLAGDMPRLAAIRAGLRAQMANSPLCDGPRFAENLMTVLREFWARRA